MGSNKEIFDDDNYKIISTLIDKNLHILRQNMLFNKKYLKLTNTIDLLETNLPDNLKEQFHDIIKLFYETEEYYFALSYSLGVKYGENLKKLH